MVLLTEANSTSGIAAATDCC